MVLESSVILDLVAFLIACRAIEPEKPGRFASGQLFPVGFFSISGLIHTFLELPGTFLDKTKEPRVFNQTG